MTTTETNWRPLPSMPNVAAEVWERTKEFGLDCENVCLDLHCIGDEEVEWREIDGDRMAFRVGSTLIVVDHHEDMRQHVTDVRLTLEAPRLRGRGGGWVACHLCESGCSAPVATQPPAPPLCAECARRML